MFIGADDVWRHRPLYHEIVTRARAAGLAGATALRGCEGYGASALVHTTRILSLTEDLPLVVIIIDTEERIRAFLPQLDDLITEGMIVLDTVEVVRYSGKQDLRAPNTLAARLAAPRHTIRSVVVGPGRTPLPGPPPPCVWPT